MAIKATNITIDGTWPAIRVSVAKTQAAMNDVAAVAGTMLLA